MATYHTRATTAQREAAYKAMRRGNIIVSVGFVILLAIMLAPLVAMALRMDGIIP